MVRSLFWLIRNGYFSTEAGRGEGVIRYRLIATDIDGTLLDPHGKLTPRTLSILQDLGRKGVTVVLSTARPPRSVRPLAIELGLTGPVIAYNGALAFDVATDTFLFHHPIEPTAASRILGVIRTVSSDINVGLELADAWYVDRMDSKLQAHLARGLEPPVLGDVGQALAAADRDVSKIYFTATPEVRAAVEEQFAAAGLQLTVTSSGSGLVEILAPNINKGTALLNLARALGVPPEQTIALGDEENDIPALQVAGLGVAMGNASPAVKAAAHAVVGSNAEDGWAQAIERFVL